MSGNSSNKRIASNTFVLYLRMLITIVVNLYTVRLLWQVLGIDNYGIYNVVGGVVFLFAFLNNAMVSSSQRFISFELGAGNTDRLHKTFSISITIHFLLAAIILILAETIGLWFLNAKMNIPTARMPAANWVYQCSVLAFLISIISVPYNACIVAHEHIKIYGYMGILQVFLKLGAVFVVEWLPFDRLISYAISMLIIALIMRIIYGLYCTYYFEECRWRHYKDPHLMKDMFNFAGWSFMGSMGYAVRDQGTNIILNIFFNVTVNAAKGIANQAAGVINGFISNFTMAINPQITKRYASGQIDSMFSLVCKGCKYAFLLMGMLVIPIIIAAPDILHLWLGTVAPYTTGFLQLILITALVDSIMSPLTTSIQATGKIKKFQIIISVIMISILPLSWIWLKNGGSPYSVFIICMLASIVAIFSRIILLHEIINFSYSIFYKKVYIRTMPCIIVVFFISKYLYTLYDKNILGICFFGLTTIILYCLFSIIFVLSTSERKSFISLLSHKR